MFLHRIVELQAKSATRKTTDTQEEYDYIEALIEFFKPPIPVTRHHYLIRTPFRYPLPTAPDYQARFKPPYYPRNAFYGACAYSTAVYETAYHWLRQRVHLKNASQQVEPRTHYQVSFTDSRAIDISRRKDVKKLMNRHDYTASHRFVRESPRITSIIYPSCRDPHHGKCVVTFEIQTLGKDPKNLTTLNFMYQVQQKKCVVENPSLESRKMEVFWEEVS